MDPNAVLAEIRRVVREVLKPPKRWVDTETQVGELAELVQSLDGWLSAGGFLPKQWERK